MARPFAIGIDVGGTKIAAGLVQRDGTILNRYTTSAHSEKEPEAVIAAIEMACHALLEASGVARADIEAVGLGFPGNTNGAAGVVLVCSNLPAWAHVPLRDIVASRVGLPVLLDNDCNLAAVGEHRYGAGRGAHNMCYLTLSTGSGIGIIVDDHLYVGHTGTAGELGHVVIAPGGPPCTCGKRGCLMAYCSGIGISRMVYESIRGGADTVLRDRLPADGRRLAGEVVAAAARQGDAVAREILHTAGTYAGIALSMIIQIINPQVIVVGGGLTRMGDLLEVPMLAAMREHTQPELLDSVTVKPWQLGDDLVVIGAAAQVFASAERYQARFDAYASRFIIEKAERRRAAAGSVPSPEPLGLAERIRLEGVEGVIFDIQRYSLHDGPGLRTNVFFKGCPLRCDWCANPESQLSQPELALFAGRCIACGQFEEPCPSGWPADRDISTTLDRESAQEFSRRAAVCPTAAMCWMGERRTAGDIIGEVLRDAPFYQGGGGVTLTGGEPTMQPHLAEALLRLAKAECLSTAMETCGHTHWAVLEPLLPYLDHILFDLKHVDGEEHRRYTGVGNELILANLRRLAAWHVPLTIRLPLIPGFNATSEAMRAVAEFVRSLDGPISRIDLLPYHRLGASKYAALGRRYPWRDHPLLDETDLIDLADVLVREGLQVNIGG